MKKSSEKQPIDDLFARKLGKLSLSPHPDSFERLQKRINHDEPKRQVVFWRSHTMQLYMAAAACLGLMYLFGWLYWHSAANSTSGEAPVASNHAPVKHLQRLGAYSSDRVDSATSNEQIHSTQLALAEATFISPQKKLSSSKDDTPRKAALLRQSSPPMPNDPVVAQVEPAKAENYKDDVRVQDTTPGNQLATKQAAGHSATPASVTERVLVVTIEEPASLVAARQKAHEFIEEKAALTASDYAEADAKRGVWQHVKRFKEGELFARHNEGSTNEQRLLDRAYNGLKHSFDKNKPTKP